MTQLTVHRSTGGEMTPDPCHRVAAALLCSNVAEEVTCKDCQRGQAPARPSWLSMRRQDIDAGEPLSLFDVGAFGIAPADLGAMPKPDPCGTPDMFGGAA